MKNGKCPRCGSTTVHAKAEGVGFGSSGKVYVYTGAVTRAVPMTAYVCVTCGFIDLYVADAKKLAEVADKWSKVPVVP